MTTEVKIWKEQDESTFDSTFAEVMGTDPP